MPSNTATWHLPFHSLCPEPSFASLLWCSGHLNTALWLITQMNTGLPLGYQHMQHGHATWRGVSCPGPEQNRAGQHEITSLKMAQSTTQQLLFLEFLMWYLHSRVDCKENQRKPNCRWGAPIVWMTETGCQPLKWIEEQILHSRLIQPWFPLPFLIGTWLRPLTGESKYGSWLQIINNETLDVKSAGSPSVSGLRCKAKF